VPQPTTLLRAHSRREGTKEGERRLKKCYVIYFKRSQNFKLQRTKAYGGMINEFQRICELEILDPGIFLERLKEIIRNLR
jgi:hypothetical protein